MSRPRLILFTVLLSTLFIASCSSIPKDSSSANDRRAMCKEIKRRLILNGATTDDTVMWQQRAETGMLAQSYHEEDCN